MCARVHPADPWRASRGWQTVLKDFESLRKRYATVFRESGAGLRGETLRRFECERTFIS